VYEVALSVRSGSVRLAINEESCTVLASPGCSSFGTHRQGVRAAGTEKCSDTGVPKNLADVNSMMRLLRFLRPTTPVLSFRELAPPRYFLQAVVT